MTSKEGLVSPEDLVNRPSHYQSTNGIECIEAIRAALGDEAFVAHCRATAIKYCWRSGKKWEEAQDLRKASWYLNKAADVLETEVPEETTSVEEALPLYKDRGGLGVSSQKEHQFESLEEAARS